MSKSRGDAMTPQRPEGRPACQTEARALPLSGAVSNGIAARDARKGIAARDARKGIAARDARKGIAARDARKGIPLRNVNTAKLVRARRAVDLLSHLRTDLRPYQSLSATSR
ncbi:MAG: hypothetical protein JWO98_747 [Frankiales bacterium]|nr:hypothetical protein [Frankiales bacterium]